MFGQFGFLACLDLSIYLCMCICMYSIQLNSVFFIIENFSSPELKAQGELLFVCLTSQQLTAPSQQL